MRRSPLKSIMKHFQKTLVSVLIIFVFFMMPLGQAFADEPVNMYEQGITLYLEDRYGEAINAFRAHLKDNPRHEPSRDWIRLIESLEPIPEQSRTAVSPREPLKSEPSKPRIQSKREPLKLPEIKSVAQPIVKATSWDTKRLRSELLKAQSQHQILYTEIKQVQQALRERVNTLSD